MQKKKKNSWDLIYTISLDIYRLTSGFSMENNLSIGHELQKEINTIIDNYFSLKLSDNPKNSIYIAKSSLVSVLKLSTLLEISKEIDLIDKEKSKELHEKIFELNVDSKRTFRYLSSQIKNEFYSSTYIKNK